MAITRKAVRNSMEKLGRGAMAALAENLVVELGNRAELLESSQRVAIGDRRFLDYVRQGDQMRDRGDWAQAEGAYAAALSLFPYERTYWVQHGHMAKEQDKFATAELSYRSACALGAPAHDVMEHLRFVMARQAVDESRYPINFFHAGGNAGQAPAKADVALLARLVWNVGGMADSDMLTLLRRNRTCDELLAAMVADPRFERANRIWLELVGGDEL